MGFEEVTEASLASDVFVACLLQQSWTRLAGLSLSAFSEGVGKLLESCRTGLKEQGCVPGWEAVCSSGSGRGWRAGVAGERGEDEKNVLDCCEALPGTAGQAGLGHPWEGGGVCKL